MPAISTKALLQLALDEYNIAQALRVAREAVAGGVDLIEAGTPLIKSEGIRSVREFKARFSGNVIVADMKVLDAGEREARLACDNGADIVVVEAGASDGTIEAVLKVARAAGTRVMYDLFGVGYRKSEAEYISQDPAAHLVEQPDYLGFELAELSRLFTHAGKAGYQR